MRLWHADRRDMCRSAWLGGFRRGTCSADRGLGVLTVEVREILGLESGCLVAGQGDFQGRDRFVEVMRLSRFDDRRAYAGLAEQPRQRDLGGGRDRWVAMARTMSMTSKSSARDRSRSSVPDRRVCRSPRALAGSGEQAAGEGAVGGDADALVEAEGDHLPLVFPVEEVVTVLHRHERGPAGCTGSVLRLGELPGAHGRRTDVTRFAGAHHIVQRCHCLLDRRLIVPAVNLVKIDVIGPEAANEASMLARMWLRDSPRSFGPCPVGYCILVART